MRLYTSSKQKKDAEAGADFWSIQGDFIYRQNCEPQVQLHVPKEETFSIQLKYIDVTRSIYTDLDVMQEKSVLDCRFESKFIRFLERVHEVRSIERESSRGIYVFRVETDKNSSNHQT